MSLFPENDKARKMLVVWKYFTRYFPKAHREVTKVCVVNNVRYNPDREPNDISWARGKSPDQMGSAFRHMAEYTVDGKIYESVPAEVAKITGIDRVYVLAEAMWRIGAELELCIEREEEGQEEQPSERVAKLNHNTRQMVSELIESVSNKPKCPVCGFREHVFAAPQGVPAQWCCETGHATFYFDAKLDNDRMGHHTL